MKIGSKSKKHSFKHTSTKRGSTTNDSQSCSSSSQSATGGKNEDIPRPQSQAGVTQHDAVLTPNFASSIKFIKFGEVGHDEEQESSSLDFVIPLHHTSSLPADFHSSLLTAASLSSLPPAFSRMTRSRSTPNRIQNTMERSGSAFNLVQIMGKDDDDSTSSYEERGTELGLEADTKSESDEIKARIFRPVPHSRLPQNIRRSHSREIIAQHQNILRKWSASLDSLESLPSKTSKSSLSPGDSEVIETNRAGIIKWKEQRAYQKATRIVDSPLAIHSVASCSTTSTAYVGLNAVSPTREGAHIDSHKFFGISTKGSHGTPDSKDKNSSGSSGSKNAEIHSSPTTISSGSLSGSITTPHEDLRVKGEHLDTIEYTSAPFENSPYSFDLEGTDDPHMDELKKIPRGAYIIEEESPQRSVREILASPVQVEDQMAQLSVSPPRVFTSPPNIRRVNASKPIVTPEGLDVLKN